jgi:hypothetical protein
MQRAATGLAVACSQRLGRVYAAPVLLLVGAGNNGADALWAGAQLAARGARVGAVLAAEPVADALTAFRAAGGRVVDAPGPGLVVDGWSASAVAAACDRGRPSWPARCGTRTRWPSTCRAAWTPTPGRSPAPRCGPT